MESDRRAGRVACAVAAVLLFGWVHAAAAADGSAADVTVVPARGGGGAPVIPGFTAFDPAAVGYELSEVFLTGTASAYEPTAPVGSDGKVSVAPTSAAPFTTRAVVMRPSKPRRFNGTVVVEWLNVSGGADAGPDWTLGHTQLIREGFVWVGVSAQRVGLEALKGADPTRGDGGRYAGLAHPGDSYSYDMYSQAGRAIREQADVVLGGLEPEQVIAVGESQSAGRLVTYIDAVHPLAEVYDGYLVHSRGAGGAALSQAPQPAIAMPAPAPIRDDLGVPVLVFQAENDVFNSNASARQPDTDTFRLWEVAGTAHYDYYGLAIGREDVGDGKAEVQVLESMQHPTNAPIPTFTCDRPVNTGPMHYVINAAFSWMHRWVADGDAPPTASPLQTVGVSPVVFATNADGNVLGGVRTPAVDAPVAALSGLGQSGNAWCFLFGTTTPLSNEQITARYGDHRGFVKAWTRATNAARKAGFVTVEDAKHLNAAAARSSVGRS
jgi:hypothetical protein